MEIRFFSGKKTHYTKTLNQPSLTTYSHIFSGVNHGWRLNSRKLLYFRKQKLVVNDYWPNVSNYCNSRCKLSFAQIYLLYTLVFYAISNVSQYITPYSPYLTCNSTYYNIFHVEINMINATLHCIVYFRLLLRGPNSSGSS